MDLASVAALLGSLSGLAAMIDAIDGVLSRKRRVSFSADDLREIASGSQIKAAKFELNQVAIAAVASVRKEDSRCR